MTTRQERERLERLSKRRDFLRDRIAKAEREGKDLSYDKQEKAALDWVIEAIGMLDTILAKTDEAREYAGNLLKEMAADRARIRELEKVLQLGGTKETLCKENERLRERVRELEDGLRALSRANKLDMRLDTVEQIARDALGLWKKEDC